MAEAEVVVEVVAVWAVVVGWVAAVVEWAAVVVVAVEWVAAVAGVVVECSTPEG